MVVVISIAVALSCGLFLFLRFFFEKRMVKCEERIINCYREVLSSYSIETDDSLYPEEYYMALVLDRVFPDHIISTSEGNHVEEFFYPTYSKAHSLARVCSKMLLHVSDTMVAFINDCYSFHRLVEEHNSRVIQNKLNRHKDFFDHCLTYPLDDQQRRSIISEEDNCLVVSSAGSGKTSSIVGKVKYLIEKKGIAPQRILLISYTNKAAAELTERVGVEGLRGYTFHKLAIDLIGRVTGHKPTVYENTDKLFVNIYKEMLNDDSFRKGIMEYFVDYQAYEEDWEIVKGERRQALSEIKAANIKTLLPDMDGNNIFVRSEQESKICFALSSLGVQFRYEEPYEYQVADDMHSQYRPDFSIYYEKNGTRHRVYLEHFGVDEHGLVPTWFAQDRGITYEEANMRYGDGITWKKAVHEKYNTTLLATSSADFHYSDIRDKLKQLLGDAGIPIFEKTEDELYNMIIPEGSKKEKAFIRLIVTFVTLLKSSCLSMEEVMARTESDERSRHIVCNIFRPMYWRYMSVLQEKGQMDFTDLILQATQICRSCHPVEYNYIIVDEFQDISVDRYHFLLALREGNPPAKLYCVGDDWQSIYRFSGSDMALFSHFADYFGPTEINKIETTYRFGEPLVAYSSQFIQRNDTQLRKNIHSFNPSLKTELVFYAYARRDYCNLVEHLVASIPHDKSVFLLGRYSFDDYYLSMKFQSVKEGNRFYYMIGNRKLEFLTVHKSKGLEADFVIILQCNKDVYGFPSRVSDDPVLNYVLTKGDQYPYGEERRLFYVAITRAKKRTIVLYDQRFPSVFVDEFLHPEKVTEKSYLKHPNANKKWTRSEEKYLLMLHRDGKSVKYIAEKMGRSQTSIVMRLGKLGV